MKVSVVTISFNQAAFLERAIRSVIDQDYPHIEYIIVDPGSTDGSREIIERYRPRLGAALLEPDGGPADGLNRGFAIASGDVFFYLNADDELLPGAVGEAVRAFEESTEADVVIGNGYKVDEHGGVLSRVRSSGFGLWRCAFGACTIMQQSTFIRRAAFVACGGFNVNNRTCWDGELLVDIGRNGGKFRHVSRYWSLFRLHSGGISGSGRLEEQFQRDRARLFEKIMGRPQRKTDMMWRAVARLVKYVRDPLTPALRIWDWIFPPGTAHL